MNTEYIHTIDPISKIILDTGITINTSEQKRIALEEYTTGSYIVTTVNIKTLSGYIGITDLSKKNLYMYKAINITTPSWTPDDVYGPDDAAELAEYQLALSENREPDPVPPIVIMTFSAQNVDTGDIADRPEADKVTDSLIFYKEYLQKEGYIKGNIILPQSVVININAGVDYSAAPYNLTVTKVKDTIAAFRTEYYRLETLLDAATTLAALDDIKDNQPNWPTAIVGA